MRADFDKRWLAESQDMLVGMKEWRLQHPHARLKEIEIALDERLRRLRARILEDAALASAAANWEEEVVEEQPCCPACGAKLKARGVQATRHLQTHGGQEIALQREYGVCPGCGVEFFPPG
jgi:hypothetical protein